MTAMPTDNRPTGLLGRLFSRPGQSDALGLLGAYLMSAGAPTTDPGASQKMLGQGLQGYHQALREGRLSQMQMDQYRSEQEERQRALEREEAARNMLLGGHMGGQGPAPGSFRASQDMASPGLLASVPEASRPFLQGLAQMDPKMALQQGLKLSQEPEAKAPTTQTFFDEATGREYRAQWDPTTQQWERVGGVEAAPKPSYMPWDEFVRRENLKAGLKPDEYTLTPGAGRYRGDELLAERPVTPKTPSYMPFDEFKRREDYRVGLKPDEQYGPMQFDPNLQMYYQEDAKGRRHYQRPATGMEITTPEGTTVRTGVPTGGTTTKTTGDIEEKLLGAREGLVRLKSIQSKFRPEFQEIPTRLGVAWESLKARFGRGGGDPEDRQLLSDFADYKRDAISNINLYIKEITGAQMSEAEADRLRQGVPDPGEGIFDGDDPVSFESKMQSSIKEAEKAAIRYRHYLERGITDVETMARETPLDEMQIAVNPETGERIVLIEGQWVPIQ